jgi:hypothetical protein
MIIAFVLFAAAMPSAPAPRSALQLFDTPPLRFEARANTFISHGDGYEVQLSPQGSEVSLAGHPIRMRLIGSDGSARVFAEDPLPVTIHYYNGSSPLQWCTPQGYGRVRFQDVYPGIDLVYYGDQNRLEYDFRLAPGTDPGRIRMEYTGTESILIDRGDLVLTASEGQVRHHRPHAFQIIEGERREIAARFSLHPGREVSFEIGDYDRRAPLIIDPVLKVLAK